MGIGSWVDEQMSDVSRQTFISIVVVGVLAGGGTMWVAIVHASLLKPLMCSAGIVAMFILCMVSIKVARRMPRALPTSGANVEARVRDWLNSSRLTITNSPKDITHFRWKVKINDTTMVIYRAKEQYSEYIEFNCGLGLTKEEKSRLLQGMTPSETEAMWWAVKLELARACCGYANLADPPENFYIFKRVPIEGLSEHQFLSAISEVEAVAHAVLAVVGIARNNAGAATLPALTINAPKLPQ